MSIESEIHAASVMEVETRFHDLRAEGRLTKAEITDVAMLLDRAAGIADSELADAFTTAAAAVIDPHGLNTHANDSKDSRMFDEVIGDLNLVDSAGILDWLENQSPSDEESEHAVLRQREFARRVFVALSDRSTSNITGNRAPSHDLRNDDSNSAIRPVTRIVRGPNYGMPEGYAIVRG